MPLLPVKSRTIKITLENDLKTVADPNSGAVTPPTSKAFTDRFIPTTGVAGSVANRIRGPQKTLTLVGPTAIDIGFEAGVAEEMGLFTSFLQPWFIKPVQVTIKGESYLGTYAVASRGDKDAQNLLAKFKRSLNDFSPMVGTPGTQERAYLDIGNNPIGMKKFFGYIKRLTFSEQISNPYMIGYEMSFVGRNVDDAQIAKGKEGARAAIVRAGGR